MSSLLSTQASQDGADDAVADDDDELAAYFSSWLLCKHAKYLHTSSQGNNKALMMGIDQRPIVRA